MFARMGNGRWAIGIRRWSIEHASDTRATHSAIYERRKKDKDRISERLSEDVPSIT